MGRTAITAAEVRQAATVGYLTLPPNAVVTPLARDLAGELGVRLEPGGAAAAPVGAAVSADDLQSRVRSIIAALLAPGGAGASGPTPGPPRRPVKLVRADQVRLEPFGYPGPEPGQQVRTADVVTSTDGAPMAAGYMTLTRGCFPWTLNYDEVQIVLEGELHIGTPDGDRVGHAGDILYVPKGSQITFGTPTWARFIYVTYPANWEEQLS